MSFRQIGNPGVQFKARGPQGILGPVYYTSQPMEADGSGVSPVKNRLQAIIYHVPRNLVLNGLGLYVDIARNNSSYRLGVYVSDEYPLPSKLLFDAGNLPTTSGGYQFLTITPGIPMTAGQIVWLAASAQGAGNVATVRKGGIAGNFNPMWTYSIHPGFLDASGPVGTVCYARVNVPGALPAEFIAGVPITDISRQSSTPLVLLSVNTGGT